MTTDDVPFSKIVKGDERMVKFRKIMRDGTSAYAMDVDSLSNEIKTIHASRLVRNLKTRDVIENFQAKLVEARLQNQTYRSRLVDIKVQGFETISLLKSHIDALKSYLMTTYDHELRRYKTKEERMKVVDSVLKTGIERQQSISSLLKTVDLILEDVDQASWTIKDVTAVIQVVSENRHAKL